VSTNSKVILVDIPETYLHPVANVLTVVALGLVLAACCYVINLLSVTSMTVSWWLQVTTQFKKN